MTCTMLQPLTFFCIAPILSGLSFKISERHRDKWYDTKRESHNNRLLSHHDMRHGGIRMGVPDDFCDNGKNNIEVDWDIRNDSLYSCTKPLIAPLSPRGKPKWHCEDKEDEPIHKCMNETITYDDKIPLSGPHRPLWPVYGEYLYLPPQRWVHSLEHGALVMLYHPCANKEEVDFLKYIVKRCLRRHIITPYSELPLSQPYALVTYKCKLMMDKIDLDTAVDFIRTTALRAPERRVWRDGDYSFGILEEARTVPGSDQKDDVICPIYHPQFTGPGPQ